MKYGLLFVVTVAVSVGLSVPAFSQSDTTTTILQGLQNLHNGTTSAKPAQGQAGTTMNFDQMKAAAIAKASMTAIDTDRNGSVNKEELAALTNKFFDVADTDRNGELSEDELSTFAANMNKVLTLLR